MTGFSHHERVQWGDGPSIGTVLEIDVCPTGSVDLVTRKLAVRPFAVYLVRWDAVDGQPKNEPVWYMGSELEKM